MEQMKVKWVDGKREPQCASNPAYPDGVDVDATTLGQDGCVTALPYPAKRCGHFVVECKKCGSRGVVTTAGRADDPRSVKVPCRQLPN